MDCLAENLELQLSELELLTSMYPSSDEFYLDDPKAVTLIQSFVENKCSGEPPPMISFHVMTTVEGRQFEIRTQLTKGYPTLEPPEISISSRDISRECQSKLNQDLETFLTDSFSNDPVISSVIAWLQENVDNYLSPCDLHHQEEPLKDKDSLLHGEGCRLWIYSHHIYSKTKRKDILDLASNYQITGFSLPGKPGIICLEGSKRNTSEVWSEIKSWNWKKINVKIQEDILGHENWEQRRRFDCFQELNLVKNADTRDYHMNMGEFFKFLTAHQSDYMFKELFGISKTSE